MRLVWDRSAWEDYTHWQTTDRKVLNRINTLIDGENLIILQARYHY
ncbi:type II toxin-antitoxin system YoeB family toxin [Micrococcus luteus]|nr:type II toxin-antitoxin system YoeB family toxin [Micrococcus luteus]